MGHYGPFAQTLQPLELPGGSAEEALEDVEDEDDNHRYE